MACTYSDRIGFCTLLEIDCDFENDPMPSHSCGHYESCNSCNSCNYCDADFEVGEVCDVECEYYEG